MIDENSVRFKVALMKVLLEFKDISPITPCEAFDKISLELDVEKMGLSVMPISVYFSIKIFTEKFIEREGTGYKLTYDGWRYIRSVEKETIRRDLKIVYYGL